ncbi:MAG TPA: ATP-dependent metallopeptidase FtsH/Yme1/Tma family protein, partial [Bacillota bacterium]
MKNVHWNRVFRSFFFYLLLLFLILSLANLFSHQSEQARSLEFSVFMSKVDAGEVTRVTITDQRVTGQLKDGTSFKTVLPRDHEWVISRLYEQGVA